MKQIILHVGLHKTATSSIQNTMAGNRKLLQNHHGLHYPIFFYGKKSIANHSIPFYSAFCERPEAYHMNIRWQADVEKANADYISQIKNAINSFDAVVFSGEDISSLSLRSLEKLKLFLEKNDCSIRIICYVRTPYSFLCSSIQEKIKGGFESLKKISVPKTSNQILKLNKVFESVEYYAFQSTLKHHNGPVGFFLDLIGVKKQEKIDFRVANEGLDNISARIINFYNSVHPSIVNGVLNPDRRDPTHITTKLNSNGNKFFLTCSELELIKRELEEENKVFKNILGDWYCDDSFPVSEKVSFDDPLVLEILKSSLAFSSDFNKCVYEYIKLSGYKNKKILQ